MRRRTVLLGAALTIARGTGGERLAPGQLLVATVKSRDPDLAKSVVLLIHYDPRGAVGLTVNRRTDVPISRLFRAMKGSRAGSAPIYTGGPVPLGSNALLRSGKKLKSAPNLFGDVYLLADRVSIEATASAPASVFRVYAGYTGWTAEQLRNEVAAGLWRIMPGDAAVVFDPHPESVWARLLHK